MANSGLIIAAIIIGFFILGVVLALVCKYWCDKSYKEELMLNKDMAAVPLISTMPVIVATSPAPLVVIPKVSKQIDSSKVSAIAVPIEIEPSVTDKSSKLEIDSCNVDNATLRSGSSNADSTTTSTDKADSLTPDMQPKPSYLPLIPSPQISKDDRPLEQATEHGWLIQNPTGKPITDDDIDDNNESASDAQDAVDTEEAEMESGPKDSSDLLK